MKQILLSIVLLATTATQASDLLLKLASPVSAQLLSEKMTMQGLQSEVVTDNWIRVQANSESANFKRFVESGNVLYVQKNFKFKIYENPSLVKLRNSQAVKNYLQTHPQPFDHVPIVDNPAIPDAPVAAPGADPLLQKQWGMIDMGLEAALKINRGQKIIVAVIDTGVDYTHEDLVGNMWRNPKEIPDNQIDDDKNGFIDDVIGWDFLSNDNKPYDLATTNVGELLRGGNPGHVTHCAGNIAAVGNNGIGISGVAPNAQIMALRFIGNEGGTTANAVKAVKYAVDNGAQVLSNSWGSEGDDPSDAAGNLALKEIVKYAQDKGVLFIAAAGNGHQGAGYDNDTDPKPGVPASYNYENIISVAAVDSTDHLGGFSNWGAKTVHIAAPGVKVFSTTVGNHYSDVVVDILGANWDGTSMACPHVAGAAALYWSAHPEKNWREVKAAILNSVKPIPAVQGKVVSNGKLNVESLMKYK